MSIASSQPSSNVPASSNRAEPVDLDVPDAKPPSPNRIVPLLAETDLFRSYKETGAEVFRNEMVRRYEPHVRYLAERLLAKLPVNVELDDLVQEGNIGLLDAIDGFDAERRILFTTYASPRVNGKMLDYLRDLDNLPRYVRAIIKKLIEKESFGGSLPEDDEALAAELEVSVDAIENARSMRERDRTVSLDDLVGPAKGDKQSSRGDTVALRTDRQPIGALMSADLRAFFESGMPAEHRRILGFILDDGLSLKEIGVELNLSESRISQLFTRMVQHLSEKLAREPSKERGSLLWEIQKEFGRLEIDGGAKFQSIPERLAKVVDRISAHSEIAFVLSSVPDEYEVEGEMTRDEISALAALTPAPAPIANGDDFGFTFVD